MLVGSFFEVHGSVELSLDDRILVVEAEGPWNMESMLAAAEKVKPLSQSLLHKPWAVLAILSGDPIYVPEAAEMLVEIVRQDIVNGRVGTAVLINQSNSPAFGRRHIGGIYQKAGESFAFFDDEASARAWLYDRLEPAKIASSTELTN